MLEDADNPTTLRILSRFRHDADQILSILSECGYRLVDPTPQEQNDFRECLIAITGADYKADLVIGAFRQAGYRQTSPSDDATGHTPLQEIQ
jgi:hypothetical protein